jgi:hypothetical protein
MGINITTTTQYQQVMEKAGSPQNTGVNFPVQSVPTISAVDPTVSTVSVTGDGGLVVSNGLELFYGDFETRSLMNIKKALANVRANLGPARVAIVGDSVVAGQGAFAAAVFAGSRLWNMEHFMATTLTAKGLAAHDNSWFGENGESYTSANGKFLADPRLSVGATDASSGDISTVCGGPLWVTSNHANSSTLTDGFVAFAAGVTSTNVDVYFCNANAPTYQASTGAGPQNSVLLAAPTLVNGLPTRANAIQRATYTAASATNIFYAWKSAGGNFRVLGMDVYNSAAYGVSIWNLGRAGSKTGDYIVGVNDYDYLFNVSSMQPDLVIYQVPVINDVLALTPLASFSSNIQTYITQILSTGKTDLVLSVDNPIRIDSGSLALQRTYCAEVKRLAYVNGLNFIDINNRWVSQEICNVLGYYADDRHPRDIGYADIGSAYANFLLSI